MKCMYDYNNLLMLCEGIYIYSCNDLLMLCNEIGVRPHGPDDAVRLTDVRPQEPVNVVCAAAVAY